MVLYIVDVFCNFCFYFSDMVISQLNPIQAKDYSLKMELVKLKKLHFYRGHMPR